MLLQTDLVSFRKECTRTKKSQCETMWGYRKMEAVSWPKRHLRRNQAYYHFALKFLVIRTIRWVSAILHIWNDTKAVGLWVWKCRLAEWQGMAKVGAFKALRDHAHSGKTILGNFLMYLVPGAVEKGRREPWLSLLAWSAGRLDCRILSGAWILVWWRGKIHVQHTGQELGTLLGGQTSRPVHHPTVRLDFRRPGCRTRCRDCGLLTEGGKGMCERQEHWRSMLQGRNDCWGTSADKTTVLAGQWGG